MKRLALFVHYDQDNTIDDYVIGYIKELKTVVKKIIFISNCNISQKEQSKISQLVDKIIVRENIGYDFMAWKDGLCYIGYQQLTKYDEVIIVNDSCYASLYPFSEMFDVMKKKDCDFWGITQAYVYKHHLNSYFVVFRNKILSSAYFENFWENVEPQINQQDVIMKYEIGLTQFLLNKGFKIDCYIKFSLFNYLLANIYYRICAIKNDVSIVKNNNSVFCVTDVNKLLKTIFQKTKTSFKIVINPFNFNIGLIDIKRLLKKRSPVIKVKTLKNNPFNDPNIKNWKLLLKKYTNYNTDLIQIHLNRVKNKSNL